MQLLQRIATLVAAIIVFALMMTTLLDVIGRNLFNHPLRGAIELTEIGLVALSFLLLPIIAAQGRHIVADVADVLHSRLLDVAKVVLTAGLGFVLFAVIAWRTWIQAGRAASYNDITPSLGIQLAPVLYCVAILAGFTAVCFLLPLRGLPGIVRGDRTTADPQNSLL